VQKDLLEDAMLRELGVVIGSAMHRRRLAAALDGVATTMQTNPRTIEQITQDIQAATGRQERLIAAIESGTIREAETWQRMNARRREIMVLSAERDEREAEGGVLGVHGRSAGRSQRDAMLSLAMDLRAMAERLDGPALRELVRPWIESATCDTDGRTLTVVIRSIPVLMGRTDAGSAHGLPALPGMLPALSWLDDPLATLYPAPRGHGGSVYALRPGRFRQAARPRRSDART
jgi:hypothetical protein